MRQSFKIAPDRRRMGRMIRLSMLFAFAALVASLMAASVVASAKTQAQAVVVAGGSAGTGWPGDGNPPG